MKNLYTYEAHPSFGAVSTRIDLDGAMPRVILTPHRAKDDYEVNIMMTPALARKVARALNKAAKSVSA